MGSPSESASSSTAPAAVSSPPISTAGSSFPAPGYRSNQQITSHMLMMMDENVEILTDLDDQISLESAAQQSRMSGTKLSSHEAIGFPDVAEAHEATQKLYLYLRNRMLTVWLQNPREELTYDRCMSEIAPPYNSDVTLVMRVHAFLNRYGYINYGIYKRADPPAITKKDQTNSVIVIGAGMAGITAARQLESFGFTVTVLEARDRVGGRIETFQKGAYCADLGAMIITGLGGNPMAVIGRQIPMEMQKIRSKCPLYERNGATVPKDKDELVESEWNKILEAVAYLAHTMHFTEVAGKPLPLGQAIELVIKLQEKSVRERQIEYWKTIIELQDRQKDNQHRLLRLRELIVKLTEQHRQAQSESQSADAYDPVLDFGVRSKKRDLQATIREYDKLLDFQREIDDSLVELEECKPPDTYLTERDRRILDWHLANLEFANATPVSKSSLKHWDQDDEFELSGSHLSVPGGYSIVPIQLASGLDIRMGCAVKIVQHSTSGAQVTIERLATGEQETLTADAVLCTLPLGVLKACAQRASKSESSDSQLDERGLVEFRPALPQWKVDTINRLGFGSLNKVALCFDRVFWDPNVHVLGQIPQTSESRGEFFQFWNLSKDPSKSPILLGLIAGEAADRMESASDEIIVGCCIGALKRIFGQNRTIEATDAVVTRWRSDPYSRGSYSYVSIEASGDDYDLLAAPVPAKEDARPRLFFAGEHTIRNYPATVHGALLSGLREAGRIADQFLGVPYAMPLLNAPSARLSTSSN